MRLVQDVSSVSKNGKYIIIYESGENMLVFLFACIVSFLPSLALFFWLRNSIKEEKAFRKLCDKTLGK